MGFTEMWDFTGEILAMGIKKCLKGKIACYLDIVETLGIGRHELSFLKSCSRLVVKSRVYPGSSPATM